MLYFALKYTEIFSFLLDKNIKWLEKTPENYYGDTEAYISRITLLTSVGLKMKFFTNYPASSASTFCTTHLGMLGRRVWHTMLSVSCRLGELKMEHWPPIHNTEISRENREFS